MSTAVLPQSRKSYTPSAAAFQVYHPLYGHIDIPRGIETLDHFRSWRHSGILPEKLKVHYIQGLILVETDMEELESHNLLKSAIGACLHYLVEDGDVGVYCPDGMLFSNDLSALATEPDGMVIQNDTFSSGRIVKRAGKKRKAKATELVGTPDLVIEVVSPSSEDKDFDRLLLAYHSAGIPEYWLIDARADDSIRFDIHISTRGGYRVQKPNGDWHKSAVLRREFRITRKANRAGLLIYRLDVRHP